MKRMTSTWTTTIAAAALLALPLAGHAQTEQTTSPPQSSAPQSSEGSDSGTKQRRLAQEHLRKADAALSGLPAASLPGDAQASVAELKRRISTLQQSDAAARDAAVEQAPVALGASSAAPDDRRRTALAAIERTLTELLGAEGATGAAAAPGGAAVGTTDTAAAPMDDAARTTLQQVRTHITAYAAAMGSVDRAHETAGAPSPSSSSSSSSPPSAASATASTSPTDPTPTPTGTSPTDMPQTPAPSDEATDRRQGTSTGVREESVRRHLTAARNTLSQVTQLPAAAQLSGDTRTQVSQVITSFNGLITANTAWRGSLDKVKSALERLLSEEPGAAGARAETAEPVGTTGATPLDPQIREKLIEFRTHLEAFEKAASSAAEAAGSATAIEAPGVAARASETDPATASGSTSTGSEIGGMPGPSAAASATRTPSPAGIASIPDEALRHIEAIEAILGRHTQADAAGTTGTTGTPPDRGATAAQGSSPALDDAHVDEIRRHLNELRSLIETRGQQR